MVGGIKGELKRALDNYYSKYPAFVETSSSLMHNFPMKIQKTDTFHIARFDLFSKVGLLTREEIIDNEGNFFGPPSTTPNAVQYALTDKGKKFFKTSCGSSQIMEEDGFIFGQIKVIGITDYSEPANMMGHIISTVKYQTKVKNIENWADSDELRANFKEIKEAFDSQRTPTNQEATLVKMGSGWVHSDLVGQ